MRILRLALRHYRGAAEREVRFEPRGVTIVSGPNEVGKSSLAEAVELLFEERDDTAKQRVREIQPVDCDEGSEVEADVELGPHAFRYAKRFHRRSATELAVREPRVETLTGREAHERVREWLDRHLDVALWRALRIAQGADASAPALASSVSLAAALDRAAGVGAGGEREESLFECARAEFEAHFTPTGRPRRQIAAAQQTLAETAGAERELRAKLDALERDAELVRGLEQGVAEREQQLAAGRAALRGLEEELAAQSALRGEWERAGAQLDAARAQQAHAIQLARQRGQLVSAHAGAQAEVESLAEALESEEPAHVALAAELRHVEERVAQARALRERAEEAAAHARSAAVLRRAQRELADLAERSERIAREQQEAARAREVLSGPPIDEARVAEIQVAQLAVERAQARLAAEGPRVQVVPEVDLELIVDGRRERLRAGVPAEQRVAEALVLSLPGVADVTVIAGLGMAERRKALEQAETRMRGLCMEVGVEDHAGAVAALAVRRAAAAELERSARRLAAALGADSLDALARRRSELTARCEQDAARLAGAALLPDTLEAADAALEQADRTAALARESAEQLAQRHDEANARFQRCDQHRSDTRHRLELADQTRAALGDRLAAARSEVLDEALELGREARAAEAAALESAASEAAARLARREPERTAASAASQRAAVAAGERALREQRDALLDLRARIDVIGGEGLFERRQAAERARARAERELARLERRANAARSLFEALRDERAAARSHYAAPLAAAIAELGRPLFGADFAVELDDELRVVRRVLAGRSLLASQLSAGAREQLALLVRLAAARLAGGVPIWLDDALGHTDPARLAALGPLLAAAGEHTQVIVLTCSPERFRSVVGARVVELC